MAANTAPLLLMRLSISDSVMTTWERGLRFMGVGNDVFGNTVFETQPGVFPLPVKLAVLADDVVT
jgi:hypothetical protein